MDQLRPVLSTTAYFFQFLSLIGLCAFAICGGVLTTLAAAGLLPWLHLPVSLGGVDVYDAGMLAQIGVTLFLISMCFLIPTNRRVLKLEHAHHAFSIRMEDVARAYAAVHADDRKGLFQCQSEFDAVKERIMHLHAHPDLGSLEPDILEVAAQMSRVSQDLAEAYSDERVDRAYDFLRQRQTEIASFQDRLDHAKAIHMDIRQWANRIELDEAVARSQLDQLVEALNDVLPQIQTEKAKKQHKDRVVPMQQVVQS